MKKVFYCFFLLILTQNAYSQKCRDFYCVINRVKENLKETAENKYQRATDNLNDAEAYIVEGDIAKKDTVKKYRKLIFTAIEKERSDAIIAKDQAIIARAMADTSTKNATALYWASEADKLNPTQGMRLLEEAEKISKDEKVLNFIQEQTKDIFNNSNSHQFLERAKIISSSLRVSPDKKFAFYKTQHKNNSDYECIIWEIGTNRYLDFLKNESVVSAFFSKNSRYIKTRDGERKNKIWDMASGTVRYEFVQDNNLFAPFFSDDENWIQFNGKTGLQTTNIETGKNLDFIDKNDAFRNIKFSDSGKWLITLSKERNIKIWDVNKKTIVDSAKIEPNGLVCQFSGDEKYLFIRTGRNKNILYDLEQEQVVKNFDKFIDISFSADNKWLFCSDSLEKVHFFDKNTLKTNEFLSNINTKKVFFSLDNNLVFDDKTYELIDLNTEEKYDFLKNEKDDLLKDNKNITGIKFSKNKKWLFTFHSDKSKKLWSIQNGVAYDFSNALNDKTDNEIVYLTDSETSIAFLEDNQHFISVIYNKLVLWQLPILFHKNFNIKRGSLEFSELSDDCKYLIVGEEESPKEIYNIEINKKLNFSINEKFSEITFSPNSHWAIIRDEKEKVTIWDLGKIIKNPYFIERELKEWDEIDYFFSENSEWVILNNKIKEITTGKLHPFFEDKDDSFNELFVVSSNSKWFYFKEENNILKIYDVESKNVIDFESKETNTKYSFSLDGNYLICENESVGKLSNYTFFDIKNKIKYEFLKKRGQLYDFEISPNNKWIQFRNEESKFEIWDLVAGKFGYKKEFDAPPIFLKLENKCLLFQNFGTQQHILDLNTAQISTISTSEYGNIEYALSKGDKYLSIMDNTLKFIKTYDLTTNPIKLKNTVFFNTNPLAIKYSDEYLYITVGRSVVKFNPNYEGAFFNYGDGDVLKYEYEEIQEWKKAYGNSCLQQISQETIEKYEIKKYKN